MAKINIHIELDTQKDDISTLIAIADAFGGKVTIEPKTPTNKTKNVAKTEEPKELTREPGDGLVEIVAEESKEDVTVEETNYTVDDVRTAMMEAKRAGKDTADLRAILKANGASVVSDLDPKKYAAVIKAVKAL